MLTSRKRFHNVKRVRTNEVLSSRLCSWPVGGNSVRLTKTAQTLVLNTRIDDPSLDSRLSYLRRRATLDARAALFVLSPVSQAELNEFVRRCAALLQNHICASDISFKSSRSPHRSCSGILYSALKTRPSEEESGTAKSFFRLCPHCWSARYSFAARRLDS